MRSFFVILANAHRATQIISAYFILILVVVTTLFPTLYFLNESRIIRENTEKMRHQSAKLTRFSILHKDPNSVENSEQNEMVAQLFYQSPNRDLAAIEFQRKLEDLSSEIGIQISSIGSTDFRSVDGIEVIEIRLKAVGSNEEILNLLIALEQNRPPVILRGGAINSNENIVPSKQALTIDLLLASPYRSTDNTSEPANL